MNAPVLGQATRVPVSDIESELKRQRTAISIPGDAPLQLVRMATLVVFCDSIERATEIDDELLDISSVHPARALLLVGLPDTQGSEMFATIKVRPMHRSGSRVTICEQVTLVASGPVVQRLPAVVRGLVLSDIPQNLWWATTTPPPLGGPLEADLADSSQQVVYDSRGWMDPARGVIATSSWLDQIEIPRPGGRWRTASDLSWRRLKYWRRLIAQSLNPASVPGSAETLSEIVVEHGPHAVGQAWMLACWLCMRHGWQIQGGKIQPGTQLAWRCTLPSGGTGWIRVVRLDQGPPEICRVRLVCAVNGMPGALNFAVESPQRLALTVEGADTQPRTITTPLLTLAEVIGRQLNDRDRDPIFREVMGRCRTMAQSLMDH